MQLLHLVPEQDQRLRGLGIAKCPGLQVHSRLLPHGLPVAGQRCGGVTAKQELVVPYVSALTIGFQEVVAVKQLILRLSLMVLEGNLLGHIGIGQGKLEHHFKEPGVSRVLHHPLALHPAGSLGCAALLGHTAGGRGVSASLEGIGDAQDLPALLVGLAQEGQLILQIALELIDIDHGLLSRVIEVPNLPVLRSHLQTLGKGGAASGLQQPVDDLLFQPVGGVLLIGDHVHIGIAQQLAEYADAALDHDGHAIGLVQGHFHRFHHRNGIARSVHRHLNGHLNDLLGLGLVHVTAAATGAAVALCAVAIHRLYFAARPAHRLMPGLVVLQRLQHHIVDPGELVDGARVAALVADVHGHSLIAAVFAAGASQLRLRLAFGIYALAVPAPHRRLGTGLLQNEPVHIVHPGVNSRLRAELFGVGHTHRQFAVALGTVPFHQESHAALNGHGALGHVVHFLKGQSVQLIAQEMLNDVGQMLVLLPLGSNFRLRDGGADLRLHILKNDVSHMAGLLLLALVAIHQRLQVRVPFI